MHSINCPTCGQTYHFSDKRLGKKLRCVECQETFRVTARESATEMPANLVEESDRSNAPRFFHKISRDPSAAIEGSVSGAISGILSGVLGAVLVGILSGEDVGEIVAAALLGFVIGFGIGAVSGAILGAGGRHARPGRRTVSRFTSSLSGAIIGSLVVAIVGNVYWIPLGAAIGIGGAGIWMVLRDRMELHLGSPTSTPEKEPSNVGVEDKNRRISI